MNKRINIYQATKDGLLKYFATNYDNNEILFTDVSLTSILARIRLTHPDYNIFNVDTNTWIDYASNHEQQKLEPATRFDAGKIPYHLFPLDAFEEICKVMDFGAKKYAERNWEQGMSWSRVARSMLSHFISMCKGIERDEESDIPHAAHMAWNAIVLLAYTLRPKLHSLNDLSHLYSGTKE